MTIERRIPGLVLYYIVYSGTGDKHGIGVQYRVRACMGSVSPGELKEYISAYGNSSDWKSAERIKQ